MRKQHEDNRCQMFKEIICHSPGRSMAADWEYTVADDDFNHRLYAADLLQAVVIVYETRKLNVAGNIMRFLIWFKKQWVCDFEENNKDFYRSWLDTRANKYKQDIEKYLLLV